MGHETAAEWWDNLTDNPKVEKKDPSMVARMVYMKEHLGHSLV
jgi:hypothetical protein